MSDADESQARGGEGGGGSSDAPSAFGGRAPTKEGARFHTSSESSGGEEANDGNGMEGLSYVNGDVKPLSPIKKKPRDENVPEPLNIEGGLGMVPESPPKFVSLDQIMKAANGVTNMALAHEIATDDSFKLSQPEYPESSLEHIVKETLQKAFWDVIEQQLNEDPPNYERALVVLEEAKGMLLGMTMPYNTRLREEIEQILDLDLIRQQAEHGTIDFHGYARHVISLMARMCAPIRDASVKQLLDIKETVPLFRAIMEQLSQMRIDMANFTIQQVRPHIQTHSVAYERNKFKDFMELQASASPGTDPLARTRQWLKRSYDLLRELSDQHSPDPINGPGCKGPGFSSVLAGAYVELLSWPDDAPYPETLQLDQARYAALKDQVQVSALVASILSITYGHGGPALQGISDFKEDLKGHTQLLLEGSADSSEVELQETLKGVAGQVIKDVQECLQKHGFHQLQLSQERLLYDQVVAMASPDHPVRKLLLMRVLDFIKVAISVGSARPTQIPPGLSCLEKELMSITGQFLRLVTHNRAVFSDIYGDIVTELRKA